MSFPMLSAWGLREVPADAPKCPHIFPSPSAALGSPAAHPCLPLVPLTSTASVFLSTPACLNMEYFLLSDLNLCFFRLNSLFLPIYFSPVISVLGDVCDSY